MADYSWKDTFSALADKLAEYENRQPELVEILRAIGVDKGLEDKLADGSRSILEAIDPFTFFSTFMKYGIQTRLQFFRELAKQTGWEVPVPTGFDGVPSAQPLKVWLFPYEGKRTDEMIPSLWALFHEARKRNIDEQLFNFVLSIPSVGLAKLTQCLFYIDPSYYFPVDGQTKPWLREHNYSIPTDNWKSYKTLLNILKEKNTKPIYEISYEAWFANQSQKRTNTAASVQTPVTNNVVATGNISEQGSTYTTHRPALNQILYGPPGTGKTYATTELAVKITDPEAYEALCEKYVDEDLRHTMKAKYDELVSRGRIDFATFHQSFSYEDLVEGIRAETSDDDGSLTYKVAEGVFKRIADLASKTIGGENTLGLAESPTIWKISIGRRDEVQMRNDYIKAGEARIGWNDTGDLSIPLDDRDECEQKYWNGLTSPNHNVLNDFSESMKVGDVLLCFKDKFTVGAIGVVKSEYKFEADASAQDRNFAHFRDVNWLVTGIDLDVEHLNGGKRMVQKTLYALGRMNWKSLISEVKRQGIHIPGIDSTDESKPSPNHVIIIDEINRGNTARIFGELITLLEPDKRKGGSDERVVILPYSKEPFTVPSNLYVIGTMNTADKSLAQLDLALRRRFEFVEVMPDASLLEDITVHGVSIQHLLQTINDRIEVLLDRDYLIGHSYFWPLKSTEDEPSRVHLLADIFKKRVFPLLQEYFFADWEKIGWVLNDISKPKEFRFVQLGESEKKLDELFNADIAAELVDRRYQINEKAFLAPEAYQGIFLGSHE